MAPIQPNADQGFQSSTAHFFASLVQTSTESIDYLILALGLLLIFDLAFIFVYYFCVADTKAKAVEENKGSSAKTAAKPGSEMMHKCNNPSCTHSKVAAPDGHIEEDENLVFDEQADVVFMQPGFNIKDATTAQTMNKSQAKKSSP